MFNKRKAQGLSITTIIVAVIVLIVLVVIAISTYLTENWICCGATPFSSCENSCGHFAMENSKNIYVKSDCEDTEGIERRWVETRTIDVPEGGCCCEINQGI